jgi:hypothetical protein
MCDFDYLKFGLFLIVVVPVLSITFLLVYAGWKAIRGEL